MTTQLLSFTENLLQVLATNRFLEPQEYERYS